MYNWHKALKYTITLLCCAFFINAQTGSARQNLTDTMLLERYLTKGGDLSSHNNDSALFYADRVLQLAEQAGLQTYIAQAYYLKSKIYFFIADYKTAQSFQRKAFIIAQKKGDLKLIGKLYNLSGALLYSLGDYANALKQYQNRLAINILQRDTSDMLQAYYNMSLIYSVRAEHRKTIDVTYKALDLAEKTKDSINQMALYEGLGTAYYSLDEHEKGLEALNKAYRIAVLKKDDYSQAGILIDFGNLYQKKKMDSKALSYYDEAIAIARKNGDRRRLAVALSNKATSIIQMQDLQSAMMHLEEAIKIHKEIDNTKGLADAMAVKAEAYYNAKNYKEALTYAIESTETTVKMNARKEESTSYLLLSKIYEAMDDKSKAFYYYRRYVNLRDTLESKEEIRAVSGIEFNYEKEKIERQQRYERDLSEKQLNKQKQIRNIIFMAGIIMLGLFFFILRNYNEKQKANTEISKQHQIIEKQNKDILESINYSRKIQEAILAPAENIKQLLPDSFVLYKPKDIVSGDFYFIEPVFSKTNNNKWVAVALADCTGHGVPGALMSLTGYNILKQTLDHPGINDPAEALDYLNTELYHFLKQNQKEQQIRDGMDISFCAVNFEKGEMMFSGANNPVWIVSKIKNKKDLSGKELLAVAEQGEFFIYEVKANKQHVGYNEKTEKFSNHKIALEKGEMIYLFTDGYADQFGGKDGKKFMYKRFRETLIAINPLTMEEQRLALQNAFETWKGEREQVDDVSVIGIRI